MSSASTVVHIQDPGKHVSPRNAKSHIPESPFRHGTEFEVLSHAVNSPKHTVEILLEWRETNETVRMTSRIPEIDVQKSISETLYAYWRKLGGRCVVTNLSMYHVYKILEETDNKYLVQWIGYGENEASWEPKGKIRRICPQGVITWIAWIKEEAMV
ncbi:hypothetical protein ACHAPU_008437 [Fusarium lateritium]